MQLLLIVSIVLTIVFAMWFLSRITHSMDPEPHGGKHPELEHDPDELRNDDSEESEDDFFDE
jgi:hypothetical protein